MEVVDWIYYDSIDGREENGLGGLGGWFDKGLRWKDYLDNCSAEIKEYAEAFRRAVIKSHLKAGGDWHQSEDEGVPVFSDGTIATFSYRAWGDIMAAIWAEEENKDYTYMSFYMDCLIK
jgi:hypothetical protein